MEFLGYRMKTDLKMIENIINYFNEKGYSSEPVRYVQVENNVLHITCLSPNCSKVENMTYNFKSEDTAEEVGIIFNTSGLTGLKEFYAALSANYVTISSYLLYGSNPENDSEKDTEK